MPLAAMVQPALAQLTMVLVSAPPGDSDPASGKGPEWGKAAPIGLLIWLLMGLALFFLIKSMNRNLRKVPASFDKTEPAPGSAAADVTAGDGGVGDGGVGDGHPAGIIADGASADSPPGRERDA